MIEKLKLLFKASKPVGEFVNQIKGARKKYKTIPFWITLSGSLISLIGALSGFIPATAAAIAIGVLNIFYNVLRGLDKGNQVGIKPPMRTTEFWLGIGALVSTQIVDWQTAGINNQTLITIQGFLGAAMAAAQSLAAHQPTQPTEPPK